MSNVHDDAGTTPASPEELQHEIEQTREQLGDTVEALARKVDVKHHAQAKAAEVKDAARERRGPLIATGVGLAAALLLLRARRR